MPQERILVVDDDSVVRNIIAVMLSRSGYYPTVAANADEALNILREDPGFDLSSSPTS
jgi:CheY-like chemotaxis protein